MPTALHAILLFLCLLLTGCDRQALVDMLASAEQQAHVRGQVERLQARDFAAVEAALDPSLAGPGLRPALERMAALIPAGRARSVQIVGAQKQYRDGVTSIAFTIEYAFADGWLLAQVALAEQGGQRRITALHITPRTQSLEQEHAFRLAGKGASQYVVLAGALASLALSLCALVVCARTRGLRRKGLWVVFILLGFGKLTVNWTTGELFLLPLSVQLFGASAMAELGAPWMIAASLPVGALVFLLREARRQDAAALPA